MAGLLGAWHTENLRWTDENSAGLKISPCSYVPKTEFKC